jgi:hypothetical protein
MLQTRTASDTGFRAGVVQAWFSGVNNTKFCAAELMFGLVELEPKLELEPWLDIDQIKFQSPGILGQTAMQNDGVIHNLFNCI